MEDVRRSLKHIGNSEYALLITLSLNEKFVHLHRQVKVMQK